MLTGDVELHSVRGKVGENTAHPCVAETRFMLYSCISHIGIFRYYFARICITHHNQGQDCINCEFLIVHALQLLTLIQSRHGSYARSRKGYLWVRLFVLFALNPIFFNSILCPALSQVSSLMAQNGTGGRCWTNHQARPQGSYSLPDRCYPPRFTWYSPSTFCHWQQDSPHPQEPWYTCCPMFLFSLLIYPLFFSFQ